MDFTLWMNNASAKIDSLASHTEFALKDLYVGTDWDALPKGDRLGLGKHFKNEVVDGRVPGVRFVGKYQNNSAKYVKD